MNSLKLSFVACLALISGALSAAGSVSGDGAWTSVEPQGITAARSVTPAMQWVSPRKYAAFSFNAPVVESAAAAAPPETARTVRGSGVTISVPKPDGTFENFQIIDVPTMEPALAEKYPNIHTFSGVGIDDPSSTIRGDVGPQGFRASVRNGVSPYYVDPLYQGNTDLHVSYLVADSGDQTPHECHADELVEAAMGEFVKDADAAAEFGNDFRTYRFAMATTGEYTALTGGTVASTMAVVVSLVNRLNQILEADLAVRLLLVANNNLLIFTDPATDGYTNTSTSLLLSENQTIVPPIIGNANFDVAHVMNSSGGGRASGAVVCDDTIKCRGTTGTGADLLSVNQISFLAHEVGHQFGAGHTFNGVTANCSAANYSASNAYEPGSGNTIMSYAGTCGVDNFPGNMWEPYYNRRSLNTIMTFIESTLCPVVAPSGNTPPAVNGGSDIVVPVSTPFKLKAAGSDADGDTVFFCWEQFDLASAPRTLGTPDPGDGPLFRSFFPTINPARYFPVNPAAPRPEEQLPTVANRDLTFAVTARDFRTAGGGTNDDEVLVHVEAAPVNPFRVTVGNTPGEVWTGTTKMITWDVAGTNSLPYNVYNVNIMLSVDGGNTYPYLLKENSLNDGSELVTLPNVTSKLVRVRVEPSESGVYDINDADVTIGGQLNANPAIADFGIACPGEEFDRTIEIFNTGSGDLTIGAVTKSGSPAFTLVPSDSFPEPETPVVIAPGSHVNFTVHLTVPTTLGSHTALVVFTSTDPVTQDTEVPVTVTVGEPNISAFVPNAGNFGNICAGDKKDMPLTVTNSGLCPLIITSLVTTSANFPVPSEITFPVTIAPGISVQVPIRFQGVTYFGKSATISISSNDPDEPLKAISVSGFVGTPAIGTTIAASGNFGDVCVGSSKDMSIVVTNSGICDLDLVTISSDSPDFIVPDSIPGPLSVQAGTSVEIPIRFQPLSQGAKSAVITIGSDDPVFVNKTVNVSGNAPGGTISVTACPLDFGVVCADDAAARRKTVTVCNTGNCPLNVNSISVGGTDFVLEGLPAFPVTVQSGSCFTYTVKFTPDSVGVKTSTITTTSDDPANPIVVCTVSAETVAAQLSASGKLAFQPTVISTVGHCPSYEVLSVANTGLCNVQVTTATISGVNADSFSLVGLPDSAGPLVVSPGGLLGAGQLQVQFKPGQMITERFHQAEVTVTYISDPFTLAEETVTIPLMGEATQTGFRILVRAGGVPVDEVLKLKATIKGVGANGKKQKQNLSLKNATLRTVVAPDPFTQEMSFQYHAEFGALTNSTQMPTGEVLMKVQFRIGKKKVTRTIRFQNLSTCTFNKDVIADF